MNDHTKTHWDAKYKNAATLPSAAAVLEQNQHLLPTTGKALDLACGRGGNALLLARTGLESHAWDISEVALAQLEQMTDQKGLCIHGQARDIEAQPPEANSFDIIIVSHYLERSLCPAISAALRPGGLLFYQTFSRETVTEGGPRNPLYRLAPGELLELFTGLMPVVYQDLGRIGNTDKGFRDQAMLIAQKTDL